MSDALSYTIPDAVKKTGISKTVLYDRIASGELRAKKLGSKTLILHAHLMAYLEALPDLAARREAAQ